jgi:hypothetical protein
MRKYILITLLSFGLVLPSVPDHGVLPGLTGQGVGGGADDHGLGNDDTPTFTGMIVSGNEITISTSQTPATPSAAGTQGDISWDSDYIYVAVAANTWKRTALSSWAVTDILLLDDGASKLFLDDGSSYLLIRP